MIKLLLLSLLFLPLLLTSCGIEDIGSERNTVNTETTTNTDNSETNGIFETTFGCQVENTEGGVLVHTIGVSGAIQDGPEFFEELPSECGSIEGDSDETIIVEDSTGTTTTSNDFTF